MKHLWIIYILSLLMGGCTSAAQEHDEATAELTILTEEFFPLSFMENGNISGQATEVVREIMARTGTEGDIRILPWEEGLLAVQEKSSIALFSTTMPQKRKGELQWVGSVTVLDTNLYAVRGSGIRIHTLEDARQVNRIATVADYYSEQIPLQAELKGLIDEK